MKTLELALVALVSLPIARLGAGEWTPRVLGVRMPAADAVPFFEITQLHAISNDGRWLLLTSTSDRLVTNDLNAAPDVFLFDRATGRFTLVSVAPGGTAGNGASLAPGMSADARRVVFQSRASDLTGNDTNNTWDIFVRDLTAGTTSLASVATNGVSAAGASTAPQISTDGRHVLFASEVKSLAPVTGSVVRALYRRDLSAADTVWVSQEMTDLGTLPTRTQEAAWTAGGQCAVFVASGAANQVFRRDLDAATTLRLSRATTVEPPELQTAPLAFQQPLVSDDGAFAACRFSFGRTNGCLWFDVAASFEKALGFGTNALPRQIPADLLGPAMSADGQSLAYAQPVRIPGKTDVVLQIYRWLGNEAAPLLVSAHLGSQDWSDAHAFAPRITPDGRFVAFLSTATDLVAGTTGSVPRAYLWDAQTGATTLVANLGLDTPTSELILSPNGAWLGVAAPRAGGAAVVHLTEIATGQTTAVPLEPVAVESATGRGWLGVRPEGVSADGRYVALTAFAPPSAGGTNHVQVYRLDTQTGTRQLITEGVDGRLANRHSAAPSLSADGAWVLFQSAAANLVANDVNTVPDLFAHTVASGQRRMLRSTRVASTAGALPDGYLSPEGAYAFVKFSESSRAVGRVAGVEAGTLSLPFTGTVQGASSFSEMGRWMALSRNAATSGSDFRVEVHNPEACLASTVALPNPLWRSPTTSVEPVLSADGAFLAYLSVNTAGTNAVVVMDWAINRQMSAWGLPARVVPSGLRLSADGRFVAWLAANSTTDALKQVWRGDVSTGTIALVSTAPDGVSEGNGDSKYTAISPNGRYVTFATLANNLVTNDINGAEDVFLRDMETGQTLLVSRTLSGAPGSGWSFQPFFSADGQSVFFLSGAPDLAAGDYNQGVDLFKVEIIADSDLLLVIRRNLVTGGAELLWNGQPGKSYRVEFKDDLPAADWTLMPGEFAGDAPVALDPAAGERRFFRLRE